MKKVLNIVRSAPDAFAKELLDGFSGSKEDSVIHLYKEDVDWSLLVDEIFAHDKIICWW